METRSERPLRVLDFDIETRRIGFHSAGRFSPDGCEPVAIAASWYGDPTIQLWMLEQGDESERASMLAGFKAMYDAADMVTGHYIRPFDLPIINAGLLESGLPLLEAKLTSDTQRDLVHKAGISASQENLAIMFALRQNKFHMADADWRAVARLEEQAMEEARERVTRDVVQHKALRERLIEAGALGAPKVWSP